MLEKTVIAIPTHRGLTNAPTKECVRQLVAAGAEMRVGTGLADLAGGRSWLLSRCLESAEAQGRTCILCVDDDMVFTVADANKLIEFALEHNVAASAMYPTAEGRLAATRYVTKRQGALTVERFKVGLGFCAVPVKLLQSVRDSFPGPASYTENGTIYPFCESRARYDREPAEWVAEDYDFSEKLGGVVLLPIAVGHLKTVPLYADQVTMERIANGEELERRLPAYGVLTHKNDNETERLLDARR